MLPLLIKSYNIVFIALRFRCLHIHQLLTTHFMMMLRNVDDRDEDSKYKLYNFCMSFDAVLQSKTLNLNILQSTTYLHYM